MNPKNMSQKKALQNTATHVASNSKEIATLKTRIDRLTKDAGGLAQEADKTEAELIARINGLDRSRRRIDWEIVLLFFFVIALYLIK